MRNYSTILCYVVLLVTLVSCRSLHITSIDSKEAIKPLLPPLQMEFDYVSFENALDNLDPYYEEIDFYVDEYRGVAPISIYTSSTIQNLSSLFEQIVTRNISELKGEKRGYITCRATQSIRRTELKALSILSSMTLGTLNLLGLPVAKKVMEIQLEVDIYNLNNELVQRYTGTSRAQAFIALYYGYDSKDAKEKVITDSTLKALEDIRSQIQNDAQELVNLLD